jgi:hypothetical protein
MATPGTKKRGATDGGYNGSAGRFNTNKNGLKAREQIPT